MRKLVLILSIVFLAAVAGAQEMDINEPRPAKTKARIRSLYIDKVDQRVTVIIEKGFIQDGEFVKIERFPVEFKNDPAVTKEVNVITSWTYLDAEGVEVISDVENESLGELIDTTTETQEVVVTPANNEFNQLIQAIGIKHAPLVTAIKQKMGIN